MPSAGAAILLKTRPPLPSSGFTGLPGPWELPPQANDENTAIQMPSASCLMTGYWGERARPAGRNRFRGIRRGPSDHLFGGEGAGVGGLGRIDLQRRVRDPELVV